jgi:prepilin peptidase CpaA
METFLIIFLGGVLIVAVVSDLRFQKIPNLLTFPTMAVAIVCHVVTNGLDGLLFSAGGLALGIAIFILPFLMGGMGAGDAKLMGAVGAILGLRGVFIAFLFTAIVGGVYALIILLINRQYSKGFITRHATTVKTFVLTRCFIPIPGTEEEKKPRLCYGVAIALGTFFYMFLELSGHEFII